MHMRTTGAIVVAATVMVLSGCEQIHEPWDKTGYFEQDRQRSGQLQEQLQHRARYTQHGA